MSKEDSGGNVVMKGRGRNGWGFWRVAWASNYRHTGAKTGESRARVSMIVFVCC